jgi:aspartate oxidase
MLDRSCVSCEEHCGAPIAGRVCVQPVRDELCFASDVIYAAWAVLKASLPRSSPRGVHRRADANEQAAMRVASMVIEDKFVKIWFWMRLRAHGRFERC